MKTCLLTVLLATSALAGTMFRLEVGPPVALGTAFKVKGAAVAVRAMLCDDPATLKVTATGESLASGRRQSIPLQVVTTPTAGVYAVSMLPARSDEAFQRPPAHWVIHVSGSCGNPRAEASTLVPMQDGAYLRDKVQVFRERATPQQVEAAVREVSRE